MEEIINLAVNHTVICEAHRIKYMSSPRDVKIGTHYLSLSTKMGKVAPVIVKQFIRPINISDISDTASEPCTGSDAVLHIISRTDYIFLLSPTVLYCSGWLHFFPTPPQPIIKITVKQGSQHFFFFVEP
jgi:hypothetical protein